MIFRNTGANLREVESHIFHSTFLKPKPFMKRPRVHHLLLFHCILFPTFLFSNGGPIDYAAIERTGTVQCTNRKTTTLLSEDLSITVGEQYVQVRATYRLKANRGIEDIEYGFPVDLGPDEDYGYPIWQEKLVQDFRWTLDGKNFPYEVHRDRTPFSVEQEVYGRTMEVPIERRWFLGNFSLKPDVIHTLEVEYRIKPKYADWMTSKDMFPTFDDRNFIYDLSPATYWKADEMESFSVRVDLRPVSSCGNLIWLKGLDGSTEESSGIYSLRKTGIALPATIIDLKYDLKPCLLSAEISQNLLPESRIVSITASSQLPGNYSIDNLRDMDFTTAWVEGIEGNGEGEWLEITFQEGTRLRGILMLNGYRKSGDVFQANGRVKKIKVEYVMKYGENDPLTLEELTHKMDDEPYRQLLKENFGPDAQVILGFGESAPSVQRVRITILETYPGAKYEDTCISELFFIGYE